MVKLLFLYFSILSALHAEIRTNANISFLWAVPLEKISLFGPEESEALLPDWMREDLNLVAMELYEAFLKQHNSELEDARDASARVEAFKDFQRRNFPRGANNATDLIDFFIMKEKGVSDNFKRAISAVSGVGKLIGKISTDFVNRMGFNGGTKFLYQARMWAEVLGPGDAVQSRNDATLGAVASGVVFTKIPDTTEGTPRFELLDPRGHNPPFGQDQRLVAQQGVVLLFPGWVDRLTPPHRIKFVDGGRAENQNLLRIDWIFEIGLFQFSESTLMRFFDLEMCPFARSFDVIDNQQLFKLQLEDLISLNPPITQQYNPTVNGKRL